ncbi:hypothetical protein [Nocardia jejuensis]|uniref:hypothetical protein n=1 Tax=Nocardia jejuensis TaxID=328049 RepID=UPI0008302D0E|nr:hypothetical protein [Nocardia jejuensis]
MQARENSGHDIYKSGYSIELERALNWTSGSGVILSQCEHEAAGHAVAAIVALSQDLLEPLEFEILQCAMSHSYGAPLPVEPDPTSGHLYLKPAAIQPNPMYVGATVVDTEVYESSMSEAVDTLFAMPYDLSEGQWLSWDVILVGNTLVRLPESLVPTTGDHLIVDDIDNRHRDVPMPLTRRPGGTWVGRDGLGRWSPISLRVHREFGNSDTDSHETTIRLDISVHWSVWWNEGSPGRDMLDRAVESLREMGWVTPGS